MHTASASDTEHPTPPRLGVVTAGRSVILLVAPFGFIFNDNLL